MLRFQYYRYAEHLFWTVCDLLPPFLRRLIFKLAFKRLGAGAIIDYGVYVRYPWIVSIGDGSILNQGCRIYPSFLVKGAEIVIGKGVALSPGVTLCGASHDHGSLELPDTAGTIRIHDRAWIGANALVLPGVEIGEGAVIGAGSVVTKDVPPWSVGVGNPLTVIKSREIETRNEPAAFENASGDEMPAAS
ncbi:acyltransferase [Bradyrhizobium betae]|nr:acyltransferase [Bradyrhizobium betae]